MARARSQPVAFLVVAAAIFGLSWLALRQMRDRIHETPSSSDASATPSGSITPLPSSLLDGGVAVVRVDLVAGTEGVDVTIDGAAACRSAGRSVIGRDPSAGPGSFDEVALGACLRAIDLAGRRPFAIIRRGVASVPSAHLDALAAAVRRAGIADLQIVP